MLVKPKLSSLIQSQVPEFVREDHKTFVAFLKAYYDYLETKTPDVTRLRDLDTTLDSFIKHFKNELALNLPDQIETDPRFLLQHIKDQYLSKGSEESYRLLFRLLFNKPVTIDYPAKQMLRASDGKWNQDVSLMVKVTSGHPDQIVGRLVDVITPSKIIRVQIDRRQFIEVEVERVTQISEDIYEFYIDRRYFGNISVGDRLRYKTDTIYFSGDILATTSSLSVLNPGQGFKIGQLYSIRNGQGSGSIMKITKTNSSGGIVSAEFIKFGTGYSTDFTSTIYANIGQSATGTGGSSLQIIGGDVSIVESLDGFNESGTINVANYWQTYGDGTYVGEVLREFGDSGSGANLSNLEPAVFKVSLGSLAKYPGYYLNNDGFLDDAVFIQDSRYYQAYSYVIKIDQRLETYKTYLKTLLHPAGMAVFGEYDIRNDFDVGIELESMIKILAVTEQDEVTISEIISEIFLTKGFEHSVSTSIDFVSSKVLAKLLSGHLLQNNSTADINQVDTTDNISSRGVGKRLTTHLLNDEITQDTNSAIMLDPGVSSKDFGKFLDDFPLTNDTITAKNFGKRIDDFPVVTEIPLLSMTKYIDPAISGADIATAQDNGGFMLRNPYAEAGWFLEQYVGTPINF